MNSVLGVPIIISPDRPKMQLSDDVVVSQKMRDDTNRWMIEFFGVVNMLWDGQVLKANGKLYMNPRTYDMVRNHAAVRGTTP